ncbi:MAG: AAA family ATPase [Planctomycetota bacterium]
MRLTETEILELLRTRWNPRNTPPLSDGKLAATVHSAMVNGTPRADHPGRENVAPPTGKVAPATNPKISSDGPVLIRLADVAAKPVSWVWANRIPARKLSLLGGDPDNGKSLLTLDISARISRGMDWPDNSGCAEVGSVILLSAEDDAADTIRPRLEAAGADLAKIHILEAVRERDKPRPFSLDRDVEQLEPAIKTLPDCRLVVVDPVSAYMGAGTDSHKNTDVRRVLAPLAALAQSSGVAVLAVSHMSKGQGGKALYRSMGSLGFIAAARAAWLVARDKHDPALRLFVPIKNNLAPGGVAGLSYRIESSDLEIPAPRIVWGGPVAVTADEILAAELAPSRGHVREEVEEWLENYLSDGPRPAGEVYQAAEGAGFHKRTVERGKQALGVRAIRQGFGDGGTWVWALNHQTASQEVET